MQTSELNKRSILTAVITITIGLLVIVESLGYRLGTARHMGPGYFPVILGTLMVGFGALIALTELRAKNERYRVKPSYRAFVLIVCAITAFAVMIKPFGLVPTIFATVYISALADPQSKQKTSFYISVFMCVLVIVVFKFALGFQASIIAFGEYWRFGE